MTDEFDNDLTRSLQQRAHDVPTDGRHFGDVRRRVRRRRQRHVAMGVLPALAGVAYLGSRPVAEPTEAGSAPDSTVLGLPTSTFDPTTATSTTWVGNVAPYRCADDSVYDSSEGWTYYTVCEQLPPMTVSIDPSNATTSTTWVGNDPTTTMLLGTTTSQPDPSLPVNVATTTSTTQP